MDSASATANGDMGNDYDTSDESIVTSDSSDDDDEYEDVYEEDEEEGEVNGEGDGEEVVQFKMEGEWLPITGEDVGCVPISFTAVPGLRNALPSDAKPIDYLNLFLTPDFVNNIVTQTNCYAEQWIAKHHSFLHDNPQSPVHQWIAQGQTNAEEVRAFIGVVLHMGTIQKPTLQSYWDCHWVWATPWFEDHFTYDRFLLMLKFLHFADNNAMPDPQDPKYKLHKIQPLLTHFQEKFQQYYYPGMHLSIKECTLGPGGIPDMWKMTTVGRYIPSSAKLWGVVDSKTEYLCWFEVSKAERDSTPPSKDDAAYQLVMKLMNDSGFLNHGHHLSMEKCFSSPALFQKLYAEMTTATGTVSRSCQDLPQDCLKTKLRHKGVCERRNGPLLCSLYKGSFGKTFLLSTATAGGFTQVATKRGKLVKKSKIVALYNKTMGDIAAKNWKMKSGTFEDMSKIKWTTKIAFTLISRAIVNSHIIYEMNTSDRKKMCGDTFNMAVTESLVENYPPATAAQSPDSE